MLAKRTTSEPFWFQFVDLSECRRAREQNVALLSAACTLTRIRENMYYFGRPMSFPDATHHNESSAKVPRERLSLYCSRSTHECSHNELASPARYDDSVGIFVRPSARSSGVVASAETSTVGGHCRSHG